MTNMVAAFRTSTHNYPVFPTKHNSDLKRSSEPN